MNPAILPIVFLAAYAGAASALPKLWPSSPDDPVAQKWRLEPGARWTQENGEMVLEVVYDDAGHDEFGAVFAIDGAALHDRTFRLRGEMALDGVARPKDAPGFCGAKFMMSYTTHGVADYPEPGNMVRTGTTDWKALERAFPGFPDDVVSADLTLGIQGGTGRVRYRRLRLEDVPTYKPELPVGFQCEYTDACRDLPRLRGVMSPTVGNLGEKDIRDLAKWGANALRWQFALTDPKFMPGVDNDTRYQCWFTNRLDHLTSLLPVFKECGIQVIVDCHAPPGGRGGKVAVLGTAGADATKDVDIAATAFKMFHDKTYLDRFIDNWREVARRFKDEPTIAAYDLVNEPDQKTSVTFDYLWIQEAAAKAIREIDPEKPVVVSVNEWANPKAFGYMRPIPVRNVIYTFHMYEPGDYTHQGVGTDFSKQRAGHLIAYPGGGRDKAWVRTVMDPARRFQTKWGARIYVGEFGVIRFAPGAAQYLEDILSIFEEYGWDWSYHAFREWYNWSAEHSDDINDLKPTAAPTERLKVLLKYYYPENIQLP